VQPVGIFGVHTFATQPPAPVRHLTNVHRAVRETRNKLQLIRVGNVWAEHLPLRCRVHYTLTV